MHGLEQGAQQCHPQTLQALPPQGESLLSLAQQLGLRIFNRHVVQRKQLSDEVRVLEQRYFKYLGLLASDSQVRLRGGRVKSSPSSGSRGAPGLRTLGGFPGGETEAPSGVYIPTPLPPWGSGIYP